MQIAIADNMGQVSLWCDYLGMDEDGFIRFQVINGLWTGKFKDNTVYVDYTKGVFPGLLVWAGYAKFSDNRYNEAMEYIQSQVDDPEYVMIPYEQLSNYKHQPHEEKFEDEIPF